MPRAPNPPKARLKRIDAAIDAVRPMGFPEPLIRKTVRNLLKVYGGDEGWPFIEEFSYKLLIDSILEDGAEEKNDSPRLLEIENTQPPLMIEHGVPKEKTNEDGSRILVQYTKTQSNQVESSRSQSPPLKKRIIQFNGSSSSAIPVPCSSSKGDISEAKHGKQISAGFCSPRVKVCSHTKDASTEVKSGQVFLPPLPKSQPAERRKPCYGWLDSDDDDEDEPGFVNILR